MRQMRRLFAGRSSNARPWYRLHLSTWVVLLIVASVLFLAIVPGKLNVSHSAYVGVVGWSINRHVLREHGWPLVYVVRDYPTNPPFSSITEDPTYSRFSSMVGWEPSVDWDNLPSAWALGREVQSFRPWALAADVALAGCLLLLFGAAFEWRRRRLRLGQFSLRELLLLVLLVSSALGWLMAQREQHKLLVDRLSDLDTECDGYLVSALPHWVRAVVGDEHLLPLGVNRPLYLALDWDPSAHEQIRWLVEHYPAEVVLEVDALTWDGGEKEGVERIGELRRLEALFLRHPGQQTLGLLRQLRDLRLLAVDVWTEPTADPVLACLDGLEQLEVLALKEIQISDATMLQIERMRKLRLLSLSESAVTDAGLARLARLSKLEALDLGHTDITDTGLSHLKELPRLESLDLSSTHVTDVGLSSLKAMPRLEWVDLTFTEVTDAGAAELARARPALQIDRVSQEADLAELQASIDRVRQGKSTSLQFGGNAFLSSGIFTLGDSHLEMLCGLENLEYLYVWSEHATDEGLRHLGDLKNLKSVKLFCARIRGPGLRHLARLPKLTKLDIAFTRIRGSGFENFTALEHLESLTVNSTQIDEAAIEELQRLPKLKELLIEVWSEGPPFQPRLVDQLRQALPNCRIEQR
jgi:Leucine-rich repeat (LRR) protein